MAETGRNRFTHGDPRSMGELLFESKVSLDLGMPSRPLGASVHGRMGGIHVRASAGVKLLEINYVCLITPHEN